MLSEVLERPIEFTSVSVDAFAANMRNFGMSDGWAQALRAMIIAQDAGIYDPETGAATRSSTSLRTWAEKVLKPAVDN